MARERREADLNTGSRARDLLANERTFLAWVRTAFAGVAIGIALERYGIDRDDESDQVLGVVLVAASLLLLVYGAWRHRCVRRDLEEGYFVVDRIGPTALVIGVTVLAIVAFAFSA